MTEEELKKIAVDAFDEVMTKKLEPMIGDISSAKAREIVEGLRQERYVFGKDITLLDQKTKMDFVEVARAVGSRKFMIDTKANEALIEEQDSRGGYLVSREVAAAILRIAASVGTIMNQTMKWPMKTDELGIPNYTGAFLTGSYIGVDVAGTVQGLTFGQAVLIAKKWQLAFAIGNDLLSDASVNLADWLLAIAGESLANMIDQQGFKGIGSPFVGVLNDPNATSYPMASGQTTYASFNVMDDSSAMIGNLEESVMDGAAFYMHRSVWAKLRIQKDSNGNYILPFAGLSQPRPSLSMDVLGGPIRPAGEILGLPVYTNRWLPATSDVTQTSTNFLVLGNMKAMAFGDKGELSVEQFESGAFGGKEIALSDQRGIVYKHRHALVTALPAAFVVAQTHA